MLIKHHSGEIYIRSEYQQQDNQPVTEVLLHDCYHLAALPKDINYVIDIGGHIGSFTYLAHRLWPNARLAICEVCPENIDCLRANVGAFAEIFDGAVSYQPGDLVLYNTIAVEECQSTGSSVVVPDGTNIFDGNFIFLGGVCRGDKAFILDSRPIIKYTIENICQKVNFPWIDVLKLDCEGSEDNILQNMSLDKVRYIVGESHRAHVFYEVIKQRFQDWTLEIIRNDVFPLFRLTNLKFTQSTQDVQAPNDSKENPTQG